MDPSRQNGAAPPNGAMSRAERFEDEKRRIIESCFEKKDTDGSLMETYITHIRITEFSTYPTSPPPPQARTPQTEKPRVIVVAVRKSGRVRLHKSKENSNGTFSIGKTWNLDDLTAVESYTGPTVEADKRAWAGDTGFTVTIGKPYFWQAQADKEKKFFVASLLKIYGKYTGGKAPDLVGFDQRELDQVLGVSAGKRQPASSAGVAAQQAPPPRASLSDSIASPVPSTLSVGPPSSAYGSYNSTLRSVDGAGATPPPQPQPQSQLSSRVPANGASSSPAGSFDGSRPSTVSSQVTMRRLQAGSDGSTGSLAASFTARSDDGAAAAAAVAAAQNNNKSNNTSAAAALPSVASLPARSRNGINGLSGLGGRFADAPEQTVAAALAPSPISSGQQQQQLPSSLQKPQPPQQQPQQQKQDDGRGKPPPERRRPPMDPSRPRETADDNLVPAPLMSPKGVRAKAEMLDRGAVGGGGGGGRDRERERERDRGGVGGDAAGGAVMPPPRSAARKDSISTTRSETSSLSRGVSGATADAKGPANGSFTSAAAAADSVAASSPTPAAAKPSAPPEPAEESRPGLGPMIKKKSKGDIAGAFWKAANAANAFKPRPGGAGDRLRQAATAGTAPANGSDGISGVFVPAPPKVETPPLAKSDPARPTTPAAGMASTAANSTPATATAKPDLPARALDRSSGIPEVRVSVPGSNSRPTSLQPSLSEVRAKNATDDSAAAAATEEAGSTSPRRSIVVGNDAKYLATLGVDPSILDSRSTEFTKWLDYFGWVPGEQMRAQNMEDMKIDIDRELGRAQAGGWLARFQEGDERVEAIKKGLDVAIGECDELDNLLTLYSVELSTLQDDIAYIEAQGQGLQVQAANQKLLKKELESLLSTCAITSQDLAALRVAPLETTAGLDDIEKALVTLYKAMMKIDPTMGGNSNEPRKSEDGTSSTDQAIGFNSDYGQMRIVQEKKELYTTESGSFIRRFRDFMSDQFDSAFGETRRALDGALSRKVDARHHDVGRELLWRYSPLVLYTRDVNLDAWNRFLQIYQDKAQPVYKAEFRDVVEAWKRFARKPTGDEQDLLFTSQQERQQEGLASTAARKLTVKRSQNLAKSFRYDASSASKVNLSSPAAADSNRGNLPYEVYLGIMDDLLPLMEMEQNFVVDFFHATTLEQSDFPDVVAATRPRDRRAGDLRRHRPMEPDRELARRVTRSMEVVFSFFEQDAQNLVDWVVSSDPLQGVGVLAVIERKMADMSQSNQDFLNGVLLKLHGNLEGRFKKFVDEQIRAIEETKVKIKKRKGVISFVRVFPMFATAVETMLAVVGVPDDQPGFGLGSPPPNNINNNNNAATQAIMASGGFGWLGVRRTVDNAYERIIRSMFDSLKVIARENPSIGVAAAAAAAAADPEDKEALNFHILLIENMNYFLEEVDARGGVGGPNGSSTPGTGLNGSATQLGRPRDVLEDARAQAAQELDEHLALYLSAVMRRPLGRLLEALENIEAQVAAGRSPAAVAAQPSNSKQAFNRVLGQYDAREVRKGIETLRKRVEKHFGDFDEEGGGSGQASLASGVAGGGGANGGLVQRVLRECEKFYAEVELRIAKITADVYGGDVLFEWPRNEVKGAFAFGGR